MKNLRISLTAGLSVLQLLISLPTHAETSRPQTYYLTFSGHVETLGHSASDARVQVALQLYDGKIIQKHTSVRPDGRYWMKVAFEGSPKEHVNWTLTARTSALASKVNEGRQILSREDHLEVDLPVTLTEDTFLLAMR